MTTSRLSLSVLALLAAGCGYFDPIDPQEHAVVYAPADTTVYVGGRFQARAFMANRFGDQYPSDHIEYEAMDDAVGASGGGQVTGLALGRGRVVARRGELRDTGWVTVVPEGTIAFNVTTDQVYLAVASLDGSQSRLLQSSNGGFETGATAWLPDGRIVYQRNAPGLPPLLYRAGLDGTHAPLFTPPLGVDKAQQWPQASRDGQWVYFAWGQDLWRVHPDGSGLDSLTGDETPLADAHPDPSPDGTRLVFTSRRTGVPDGFTLTIRDLASGAERSLGVLGLVPRWSPDGQWIAYWSEGSSTEPDGLFVVRPDGTGLRRVSAEGRRYVERGLDWSPDGRWLLARGEEVLELVEVATGSVLPLPWATVSDWPSWRP